MKAVAVAYLLLTSGLQALDPGQYQQLVEAPKAAPVAQAEQTKGAEVPLPKGVRLLPHYVSVGDTVEEIATMYRSKPEWILYVNPWLIHNSQLRYVRVLKVPIDVTPEARDQLDALILAMEVARARADQVAGAANQQSGDVGE